MENNSQDPESTQNIENNDVHIPSSPKSHEQPSDSQTPLNDQSPNDPEVSDDNKIPDQNNENQDQPQIIDDDDRPIRPARETFGIPNIQEEQPIEKKNQEEVPADQNKEQMNNENKGLEASVSFGEQDNKNAPEPSDDKRHLEEEKEQLENFVKEDHFKEEAESQKVEESEQKISKPPVKKPVTKKTGPAKTKFDKYASVEDRAVDPSIQKEFDEKPVGAGAGAGGFQISEYPEGMSPFPDEQTEAPQDTGPLSSRVKSKVWKVRQSAFDELAQKFQEANPNDEIFEEYSSDLEKFIADSNPGAQEKALEALRAYLTKKDKVALDGHSVTKTLVDKALGPAKPNIKTLSYETLCLMFEKMDKQGIFDGIIESINHKNQKTSCAAVLAAVELLKNYGAKRLDFLKPFFPHVEKLAGSTVSSLRGEAMNFYKEAYRFMGEGMKPFTTKLKKAQVDELEKFYAESPKELAQPLKGEIVKVATKEGEGGKAGKGAEEKQAAEGFDAYDIADPVDIFKKFNDKWASKVLGMEKWNEKKNALEEFLKEAENTPKIAQVPIQHITSMLKKLLNDNNFPIVFATVKIYGALAKGLRRHMHTQCKLIMPFILEKLKDKRSALIEETTKTLDNFLYCISPDDVLADLQEGISNKSPNMRITLLSWIDRYFERNAKTPEKLMNLFKNLLPVLKKLVDDSSNDVREAAIKSLAKQKVILGEGVIGNSFDDLNPVRLSKLNGIVSSLTGIPLSETEESTNMSTTIPKADSLAGSPIRKGGSKTGGSMASFDVPAEDRSPKTGGLSSAEKPPRSGQKVINVKPGSVKKIDPDGKKSVAKDASKMVADIEAFESTLNVDDIEGRFLELSMPERLVKGLNETAWKEKQKAIGEYSQWVAENSGVLAELAEYIYQYLKFKMKDWKESNPNVVKEALQMILNVANNPEIHQNKKSVSVILPFLLANIQEVKYSQFCHNIIQALVESIHPKFMILALINASTQETKPAKQNPKVINEICNVFSKLVDSLTLSLFPLKETIEFGKIALGGTLPASRTAGIGLFKAMYQQLGPPLNDFLTDVNPAVLKALNAEFAKIQPDKELQCKVQFRGEAERETKIELSKNLDPLASLPRVDISKDVEKFMKKLNDNDWKVKQEGLDALDSLLAANGNRISPNGLHNLVMTLKHRLNDHNKNQVKNFVAFVGKLIYALGPEGKAHAKILMPEIVKNLSDKQNLIRAETVKTCDKFADAIGAELVINSVLPLLTHESPELRQEVINWVLKNHEALPKADVKGNVTPLLAVLQDKTKDIRTLAERLMEKCVAVIGVEPYQAILKDMKPAIQDFLKPVFKKLRGEEDTTPLPDAESPNVSFEKKVEFVSRTLKKNPSEATLAQQQQQQQLQAGGKQSVGKGKTPGKLLNSQSLKSEIEETKETTKKAGGALDRSVHTMNNLSGGSLNNSMTSNTESQQYVKSITSTGEKAKRQEEDRKTKWPTEELRDDLVNKLKDHFKKNVSKDLFTKMFAADTKKNVEAVRILSKALIVEFQETVDILDMVLRWFFSKLWDNVNTQMMKESLDYFFSLSMSLEAAKYTLLDFEANVLIPCLVNRLGTGPSNLKISLHKIFPKLGGICAPQKIAGFLVDALRSRSHKTKIESIEVLAEMVKVYGPDIITPKDLKVYAKLLGDTDVNIKGNALKLMSEVGNYMGEELLNITGKDVPAKLQEIIQQQKRVATQESQSDTEESEGGLNKTANRLDIEPEFDQIKEVEEEQGLFMSQYKPRRGKDNSPKSPLLADERLMEIPKVEESDESYRRDLTDHVIEEYSEDKIQGYSQLDEPVEEEQEEEEEEIMEDEEQIKNELSNVVLLGERVEEGLFEKCLELLRRGSIAGKLDALLFIQDVISSENQENKEFLETNAGVLMGVLQTVLGNLLSKPSSKVPIKFLLYFLDLVHKLVTIKSFLKGVTEENLQDLFETLIQKVLVQTDQSRFESKDNMSIIKIMNSIILRLLENSDPNRSIIALFALASKYRRSQEDDRVLGLVLKCILKLSNALRTLVGSVKPDKILLELHLFLLDYEEDQIHVQPNIPIRAVKIILQQLVNLFGQRMLHFYTQSVENHTSPDKYLKNWIGALLQAKADKKWTPTSGGVEHLEEDDEGPSVEEAEKAQARVQELMDNITKTTNFTKVLEELYDELHKHKYVSIRPYMEGRTDSFKLYVANALQKIHFERTTLADENVLDKGRNIYNIKPVKNEEKENMEEETDAEKLQNRLNTLKIRFALLTKNGNTEFSKLCETKPEPEVEPKKKVEKQVEGKVTNGDSKVEESKEIVKETEKVTPEVIEEKKEEDEKVVKEEAPKVEIQEKKEEIEVNKAEVKKEEIEVNKAEEKKEEEVPAKLDIQTEEKVEETKVAKTGESTPANTMKADGDEELQEEQRVQEAISKMKNEPEQKIVEEKVPETEVEQKEEKANDGETNVVATAEVDETKTEEIAEKQQETEVATEEIVEEKTIPEVEKEKEAVPAQEEKVEIEKETEAIPETVEETEEKAQESEAEAKVEETEQKEEGEKEAIELKEEKEVVEQKEEQLEAEKEAAEQKEEQREEEDAPLEQEKESQDIAEEPEAEQKEEENLVVGVQEENEEEKQEEAAVKEVQEEEPKVEEEQGETGDEVHEEENEEDVHHESEEQAETLERIEEKPAEEEAAHKEEEEQHQQTEAEAEAEAVEGEIVHENEQEHEKEGEPVEEESDDSVDIL